MAATSDQLIEIRQWVGASIDEADLQARWQRLGSVARVALEVLRTERADLLAEPVKLGIDGRLNEDRTENLRALNRAIDQLEAIAGAETAGVDPVLAGQGSVAYLMPSDRYR